MGVCRFCSEVIHPNIGTSLNNSEIFRMVNAVHTSLVSNLSSNTLSMVCPSCVTLLKTTYDFKVLCETTETKIKSYVTYNLKDYTLNLANVLKGEKGIIIPQNMPICRTCLRQVAGNEYLFAHGKVIGVQFELREMMNVCFSKTNLCLTKEPILCKNCVQMLIMSFAFYNKCILLERISNNSLEEQQNIQQSYASTVHITGEPGITQPFPKENRCKQNIENCKKNTFVSETKEVKSEPKSLEDLGGTISSNKPDEISFGLNSNTISLSDVIYVKHEPGIFTEEIKLEDCLEPIYTKNVVNTDRSKPYKPVTKYYFCKTCTYTTKRKACLIKHKVVHFADYKKPIFKCKDCGYTVKRQKYLDRHMSLHAKGIDFKKHKCELCSFCTRKKSKLERHMTVHKDERETIMYKCSKCMFITKWKEYLAQHELIHNGSGEEKKFKCNECSFATNWRGSLIQHKVVHLSGEEALKFHCTECSFRTKRKDNLAKHMIRHMKDEDVRIFYCSECPFTSKYSSKLSRHLHVHKKGDELTIYTCTECSFQTRWKNNLSQHMRVHQNASEIELFKCKDCPFTTKWKTCLTEHEVMHKTGEDAKEFKCTECDFKTKWKKSLNMHQLTHNADDTIKKFKCSVCEYKTYRSHHLKRHMQVHSK